ncbi:MAG: type II toxin-antitoxin system HicA family toxin [Candidatus Woesearchaeota archaeon]
MKGETKDDALKNIREAIKLYLEPDEEEKYDHKNAVVQTITLLPRISGEELIKKLRREGFIVVRQKGSHVRLEKREGKK